MNGRKIIAIVGETGSGKGALTDLLKDQGYKAFSGGDILREIATQRGVSHTRTDLIELGNQLRAEFGGDFLLREAVRRMEDSDGTKFVFESIRNPQEVEFLKQNGAFVIGITMPDEMRFQLTRSRGREGDPITWEQFMTLKRREQGIGEDRNGLNVAACLEAADLIIPNDSSLAVFRARIDQELIPLGFLEGPRRRQEVT